MAQQVRKRYQKTLQFNSNNKESAELSRGMVYRELYLRLKGAPTLTALNNTQAKTKRGDEWGVVKKIELIANETDVIRSISGNALWWLNMFLYGAKPKVTVLLGDAATANVSFDSTLILPLWSPQSLRPIDTALDARTLSSLKVEVTWGTFTDINGDATAWTTNPTLAVHSLESYNVSGPFSQQRVFTIEQTVSATNQQFQVDLPVGPVYRAFMLNFTDADVDSAAILNNFKLVSGSTVFADQPAAVLWETQQLRTNVQRSFPGGATGVYDQDRRSTSALRTGWYYYDHVTDGFLSEGIDTLGFSEMTMELDVTVGGGTTKALIYPIQVWPIRDNKQAG